MNAVTQANTPIQPTHLGQAAAAQPATVANTPAAPLPAQLQPAAPHQLPANVAIALQPMARPTPTLSTLTTNTSGLKTPQPPMLASTPLVLDKLEKHAAATGCKLNRAQIQAFVAMGEHMVKALQTPAQGTAFRLIGHVVTNVNPPVHFSPNMEAARAISWYMAACAAGQDTVQESTGIQRTLNGDPVTDLSTKGSYVFSDPNNAIFNFLAASPLTYLRPSSHFNTQSATLPQANGKLMQCGIEDYQRQLPGEGGAMLFDKLQGAPGQERMFLKLEHTGYPSLHGSSTRVDNNGEGGAGLLHTLKRKIHHGLSYFHSRIFSDQGLDRKEHIVKGRLASSIYQPFMALMKEANALGLDRTSENQHAAASKNTGLPHVERTLLQLQQTLGGLQNPTPAELALLYQLTHVQADIVRAHTELGSQTNHLGLERKGAETHLDLSVNPTLPSFNAAATQLTGILLTTPIAQAIHNHAGYTIPAGIDRQASKDWHRDGITINGQHHPGHGSTGSNPHNLNLSTSSAAFIQACGNNTIASEWISRFLNQQLSVPILNFLSDQDFGSPYGSGLLFNGLQPTLDVQTLPNGSLEATVNFTFAASTTPMVMNKNTSQPVTLPPNAKIQGSFTLRFDNLASYNAATPPIPTMSQPLRCTHAGF